MSTLQFAPWSSDIELSFYSALASRKINHDKLDDAARKLLGRYEIQPALPPERSAHMQIHGNAFSTDELPADQYRAEGILKNVNTIEEYRALASDRKAIIKQAGKTVWDSIIDGTIFSCPSLLSSFYAIFFADLKKYKFTYHFAFPALHSSTKWERAEDRRDTRERLEAPESRLLYDAVQTWKYSVDPRQHGFFLAKRDRLLFTTEDRKPEHNSMGSAQDPPQTPKTPTAASVGFQWIVSSLSAYESGFFEGTPLEDRFICFADPSTYPENPAWPLRNLLVLAKHRWQLQDIRVLCYRDKRNTREHSNSLILHLTASSEYDGVNASSLANAQEDRDMPMVTGWERYGTEKPTARTIDLSAYMDPIKLADSAVDLNLKLMKWRIAPDLDLSVISQTKCLLLGAGTLGSYVARNLLGWGVRHITFVDNAKVSFSNPVRQPLFRYEDCTGGGRVKAERAAEALREIYPGVRTEGVVLSVPMAGHPIIGADDEAKVKADFTKLRDLVEAHDVLFLLMDTRESRWLPTVMGKSMGKIVLNAALGFDTYVVLRHGSKSTAAHSTEAPVSHASDLPVSRTSSHQPEPEQPGELLGCYFCNDVVAPADSVKDQTLDQQCTVTRPGVAAIASALAVELLTSVLQHPLRGRAPAPVTRADARDPPNHPLGLIPHSIRGFLGSWDNILTKGPAYDCCSACSPSIVKRYEKDEWEFVKRAIGEPGWIEEVSGLKEVQRRAEEAAAELDLEEVSEEEEEEEEEEVEGDRAFI